MQQDTQEQEEKQEDTVVISLDDNERRESKLITWAKANKPLAVLCSVSLLAGVTLAGLGVNELWKNHVNGQVSTDVVPARHGLEGSQSVLGNAKVVDSYGKATIATVDHQQGGKEVSAKIVAIDAVGSNGGATLVPPENIGQVGLFSRSAAPGSTKGDGTTVMTSHVNYNGITGYGAVFLTLKKGDPITVTDKNGKIVRYTVTRDPYKIDKRDPKYVEKTMSTINRKTGRNSLILITCGGNYVGGSLGYDENFIVEAHLAD